MADDNPEPMDIETNEENDLRPIAILIDSLAKDDMQVRINALKQINRIAEALGCDRTRSELIPYLSDMLDDDDEVLRIICEVLIKLLDYVGGIEYFHVLIPPYETLCVVEENSIRNLAISKLAEIVGQISDDAAVNHIPSLFERLSTSGWHTARTAAAGLAPCIYARLRENADLGVNLQSQFLQLASDSMPQVRRAVAENLAFFASKMPQPQVENVLFPVISNLVGDEQDSVRVRSLEALVNMSNLITSPDNVKKLRHQISQLCKDPSWRVRFLAASKFNSICTRLENEENSLIDLFLKLLKDPEAEVRAAAATQLPDISKYIKEESMTTKFVSTFKDLSKDENKFTRAQFAEVLVPVGARYSETFIMDHILPLVLDLLKDSEPEPRLKCLSHIDLGVLNPLDLMEAIMPCLRGLAEDSSWRIRKSVMDLLPPLSSRIGPKNVNEQIKPLIFQLMTDRVQEVRQNAAKAICEICLRVNEQSWTESTLKELCDKSKGWNYLRRQTCVDAIHNMVVVLPPEMVVKTILEFTNDPVSNVRFKVCLVIDELHQNNKLPKSSLPMVTEHLEKLASESDVDVVFFAKLALSSLHTPGIE